jgi:hypothetical protein
MSSATEQVTKIATELEGYGYKPLLKSGDIVVEGVRWGKCSIGIVPGGTAGRVEHRGPAVSGPIGFTTTHAAVLDNTGHAHREYMAARRIQLGEKVQIEGLPGTYVFEQRDARKLEGDGVKLVAVDDAAKANEARIKAENEIGWLVGLIGKAGVSTVSWRAGRAQAALEEYEAAAGEEAWVLALALAGALAQAAAAGKEV